MKLLVVEDEPKAAAYLRKGLTEEGYTVEVAHSGVDGLYMASVNEYDLVILDTPPTQNAVDFLRAPDRLCALFQDTVIGWFANPAEETGWIKRTLHRGTRLGRDCHVHAGVILGHTPMVRGEVTRASGVEVGDRTVFFPHVTVERAHGEGERTRLGEPHRCAG